MAEEHVVLPRERYNRLMLRITKQSHGDSTAERHSTENEEGKLQEGAENRLQERKKKYQRNQRIKGKKLI